MEGVITTRGENRILIIDDDFINREILKNIFSGNYTFFEAENGEDGLAAIMEHDDSLCAVLLDVNMPKMSGLEVLGRLRGTGFTDRVPVFLITSHDEVAIAEEAYGLGVMDVITKPVTSFIILRRVQSVIELFSMRRSLSATVLNQQQLLRENADTIDALHRGTIEALAAAIEFRDVESGEHTNRIYSITKYILTNTEMGEGFTDDEIESMAVGSIMHDIGKISISDSILNKPGKLTPEEFEIMKSHTVKGATLMSQLSKLQSDDAYIFACDIARHHHERWNGRGYPDGLVGDEISVWAQVVSIADVYDALISPRVYKKAFDPDTALSMILGGECGAFNPKLLRCFLSVEPDIRKWYTNDGVERTELSYAEVRTQNEARINEIVSRETRRKSMEISDVRLLVAAVKSAFTLLMFVNLTKNTYHIVDYERFHNHNANVDGNFDEMILMGAKSVPEDDRDAFLNAFSRKSLLAAYESGKSGVTLMHKQCSDDGSVHDMETSVIFTIDEASGDILEITLSRCIDRSQD